MSNNTSVGMEDYCGEELTIGDLFWHKQLRLCQVFGLNVEYCDCGAVKDGVIFFYDAKNSMPHKQSFSGLKKNITKWKPRTEVVLNVKD